MTLQKTHKYKVFSPTGQYLGLIPDNRVASDFTYNQSIATAFVQTQITIAQSADVSILPTTPILDELGNPILDENSQPILDEGALDVVGSNNSNALYACNNLIQVWEYSNYYPNGLLVFSGYISKWKAIFGGGSEGSIVLTCISNGQDLSNYLVSASNVPDQSQIIHNALDGIADVSGGAIYFTIGQTFTTGSAVSNVSAIDLYVNNTGNGVLTIELALWANVAAANGYPNNTNSSGALGKVDFIVAANFVGVQTISFASAITVSPSTQYFFSLLLLPNTFSGLQGPQFGYNTAGSGLQQTTRNGNSYGPAANGGLYFVTRFAPTSPNSIPFSNTDPSSILTSIMTNYIASGGLVGLPAAGITNTGVLTTYTFKTQTMLQGIQAILALAPANWYWYVDPATNILQFAQSGTAADFLFIKGRHINSLDIEATRENIKNIVYFTGGDDGTGTNTNIFVLVQNALGGNRTGLALLSDNRVNSTAGGVTTARLIAQEYANDNNAETYITNVTIQDQQMDTNLFKIGKMIGFANFNPFVNNLLLQIVGIQKGSDQVTLQLGTLPVRESQQFAQIQSQLAYQQTVANPATPS